MDEDYARKLRAWLRAEPGATPRRATEEREWFREVPEPAADGGDDRPRATDDRLLTPEPDSAERWSVRGQLPETQPDTDEEWVCPVIALPLPRPSAENGCRLSEAEARSRWNHPSNWHRRRRAEAEERSRREHPSNWRPRDEPGGR
ncbi:hypothetical protein [Amycolatopsis sp. cmx-4-68]|uniref:hypothetical protein n=1 Tax=Amycolatopsis sp. cmx-4-68 TaxID=2790938 RepID=UPI003978F784